jgi:putative effector of murein hydrolase
MTTALLNVSQGLKMNKKLQTVIVFVVGLVAMAVGYAVLKM